MEKNIIEGNKLCAEFMGYKYFQSPYGGWGFCKDEKDMSTWLHSNNILYHTSWDWLMPVVIKIFQLKNINGLYPQLNVLTEAYMYMDIKKIHLAVVEFIQWYNITNQTSAQGER